MASINRGSGPHEKRRTLPMLRGNRSLKQEEVVLRSTGEAEQEGISEIVNSQSEGGYVITTTRLPSQHQVRVHNHQVQRCKPPSYEPPTRPFVLQLSLTHVSFSPLLFSHYVSPVTWYPRGEVFFRGSFLLLVVPILSNEHSFT